MHISLYYIFLLIILMRYKEILNKENALINIHYLNK